MPLLTENPRRLILGNPEGIKRAGAELDPGFGLHLHTTGPGEEEAPVVK
jgi:hypothetical protein